MNHIDGVDWACLWFQLGCLVFFLLREILKQTGKNMLLILVTLSSIFLVQFQAVWAFLRAETSTGRVSHLRQTLSVQGIKTANLYCTLFVIAFCAIVWHMDQRPYKRADGTDMSSEPTERRLTYLVTTALVAVTGLIIIAFSGGINQAIENPGQAIAGQTLLLIVLSIGKVPLGRKLALRRTILPIDVALFGFTFAILLLNSRLLGAFALLQLTLVSHYRRKEASPRLILGIGASLVGIFLVFGLYRNYANIKQVAPNMSVGQYVGGSLTSGEALDWFYAGNVEGFVGLAGILTYESDRGHLDHDFGISNLSLFTQLLPNNIRLDPELPFKGISEELGEAYPYHGSVVAPGLETSYAHFGMFGILLFGLALGWGLMTMHRRLLESDRLVVMQAFASVHFISLIQQMLSTTAFFTLGDVMDVVAYERIVTWTTFRQIAPALETGSLESQA